jgi:hypothetical protein
VPLIPAQSTTKFIVAMQELRELLAHFSQLRHGINPRIFHVA